MARVWVAPSGAAAAQASPGTKCREDRRDSRLPRTYTSNLALHRRPGQAAPTSERGAPRVPADSLILSRLELFGARVPQREAVMSEVFMSPAVPNQTPPLCDYNLFTTDEALQEAEIGRAHV